MARMNNAARTPQQNYVPLQPPSYVSPNYYTPTPALPARTRPTDRQIAQVPSNVSVINPFRGGGFINDVSNNYNRSTRIYNG